MHEPVSEPDPAHYLWPSSDLDHEPDFVHELVMEKPRLSEPLNQYETIVLKMVQSFEAFDTVRNKAICWSNT